METRFLTNDPLTRKRWAKDLFAVVLPAIEYDSLIGTGADSIVQIRTELGKGEGDELKFGIRLPLVGEGIVGDKQVEGNEERLRFRDFKMGIQELNHAVDTGGKMDEQRIPYNLLTEGKDGLQTWWSEKLSDYLMNVLVGNSQYRIAGEVFADAIEEPDADHFLTPNGVVEDALDATNIMDLSFLDKLKQQAEVGDPKNGIYKLRPLMRNGKKYYKVLMHNYVFDQLKQNTNVGQWGDLLRAAQKLAEVNVEIEYNGLLISKTERIPMQRQIAGKAGIYRTAILGAQSACIAFGGAGESKGSVMAFVPYERDAKRFVMVRGGGIFGIKKVRFEGRDYGAMVASTFGAPIEA